MPRLKGELLIMINCSKDYFNDILIRMAYHSSGIEGNTISLPETVTIILENKMPTSGKTIREFYEIENHKRAFELIFNSLGRDLDTGLIKDFHKALTDRLRYDSGQFKSSQNAIVGADFETARPEQVPFLLNQWIDNLSYRLSIGKTEKEKLNCLAESHIQFERIHPFSDGNGRTGRLLLFYLAIKALKTPIIIAKEDRVSYMEYLANQDYMSLSSLLEKSLFYEKERVLQFSYKKENEIEL